MQSQSLIRAVVTSLVVASSVTGFFLLRGLVGPNAAVISVLPVAVVAAYFGTKWGLLATSIAFPANVFLLERDAGDLVSPFVSVSLLIVAWIFGRLHTMETRQREEAQSQDERLRSLEAGERRTKELLEAIPDTVLRISEAGRIMELHGERNLGLTADREDLLFRNVAVISDEWQDDLLKMARSAIERDSVQTRRHHVTVEGETKVIESRVAALPDGDAIVIARTVEGATLGPV